MVPWRRFEQQQQQHKLPVNCTMASTAKFLALVLSTGTSLASASATELTKDHIDDDAPSASVNCRDRFLEPFSSSSIWNTAIGSGAVFAPANLFATPSRYPTQFHNDQDFILRVTDADPHTKWINQVSVICFDCGHHCTLCPHHHRHHHHHYHHHHHHHHQ